MRINKCYLIERSCGVFSKGKEMNTKKLILGFCSLVAVTGGAPQVLGDKRPSPPQVLGGKRPSPHEILAAKIPAERSGPYETDLNAIEKRLKALTAKFKKMGKQVVRCVHLAALYEQRADLIGIFVTRSTKLLNYEIKWLRNAYQHACEDVVRFYIPFYRKVRQRIAKARKLRKALDSALEQRTLWPERSDNYSHLADVYRSKAVELKDKAIDFHNQRIIYLRSVIGDEIRRRHGGIDADVVKLRSVGFLGLYELEQIIGRVVQDVAVLHVVDRIYKNVTLVATSVAKAPRWQDDYDWFSWVRGDDINSSYSDCQASHVKINFNLDQGDLLAQIERSRIFGNAYKLLK
jgi:hypothetical protein